MARQLSYWTAALAGLPEQIELPADRRGRRWPAIAAGVWPDDRCRSAPRACGAGAGLRREPVHGAAGGAGGLLVAAGGGSDIAIGSPIAGRGDAALDELIGFFVNTLVLRTDTAGNPASRR